MHARNRFGMNALPQELRVYIFGFLGERCWQVRLVCRAWNNLLLGVSHYERILTIRHLTQRMSLRERGELFGNLLDKVEVQAIESLHEYGYVDEVRVMITGPFEGEYAPAGMSADIEVYSQNEGPRIHAMMGSNHIEINREPIILEGDRVQRYSQKFLSMRASVGARWMDAFRDILLKYYFLVWC